MADKHYEAVAISIVVTTRRSQQTHFVAALAALLVFLFGFEGRGEETIPHALLSFSAMLTGTPASFFKRLYRMTHHNFMVHAEKIALQDRKIFRRSSLLLRLSIALRWLAGGSYLYIAMWRGISPSTLYYYIEDKLE